MNTGFEPCSLRRAEEGGAIPGPWNSKGTGMKNTDLKGKGNIIHMVPALGIWEIAGKWGFKSLKDFLL